MRVLLLSDSHGCSARLRYVLKTESDCPIVFFLGDGIQDLMRVKDSLPARKYVVVRGNNDWNSEYTCYEDFAYQYIEGHTVVATHGHRVSIRVTMNDGNLFLDKIIKL